MKKRTICILAVLMLAAGACIGGVTAAASTGVEPRPYYVNENGQTYGGIRPYSLNPQDTPDLISAIGIDGTEGYVYAADLDGDQPSTPEEALLYMEKLEEAYAQAKETGEKYSRYIPLYASDGVTVIGQFGISFPYMG